MPAMSPVVEQKQTSKREIMHDLLGRLGEDKITLEEFLRRLRQHGMTVDDIDRYLDGKL
jgi:hypothetical protein